MFSDRPLLITEKTGSFGNTILRYFLDSDLREIRIFSRDEKKQNDLRDLNYGKFVEQGEIKISEVTEYNSHDTIRLDVSGIQALLMKVRFMQATVRGEVVEVEE